MKIMGILNELFEIFCGLAEVAGTISKKIKVHEEKGMEMPEQELISAYTKALEKKELVKATGYSNAMKARGIDHKIRD